MSKEEDDDLLDEFGLAVEARPAAPTSPSTSPFDGNALGAGIQWQESRPGMRMSIQVNFTQTGTFSGTLFGKHVT